MAVYFSTLDWVVVGLYFLLIAGIATWVALQKEKNTSDYFLASRDATWFLIGASIFASNIGAEHLVGLAGSGAGTGMAFAHWELHSYFLIVLGWVFAPFYLRSKDLHDAGVSREALHAGHPHGAVADFPGGVHPDQGVGHDLRGRHHDQNHPRLRLDQPAGLRGGRLLLVLGVRARHRHRHLHRRGRHEGRAVDRRHAGAAAPDRLDRHSARGPQSDRRPRRAACGQRGHHLAVAPAAPGRRNELAPDRFELPVRFLGRRRGSASCSARRSSGCGTGARTNTSFSACLLRATCDRRDAGRSGPAT